MNYIDCGECSTWDIADRHAKVCTRCNNSQKRIDPKDVKCNMCGECLSYVGDQFDMINDDKLSFGYAGLHGAKVSGTFGSYHLSDMTTYTFSMCEKCLRNTFNQFKIPPGINDMFFCDISYEDDNSQYEYKVWKKSGGHHQAYVDGKCNTIKDCCNDAVFTIVKYGGFSEDCSCEEHKEKYANNDAFELVDYIPNVLKAFF